MQHKRETVTGRLFVAWCLGWLIVGGIAAWVGLAGAQQPGTPPTPGDMLQQCLLREARWRQAVGNTAFDANESGAVSTYLVSQQLRDAMAKQSQDAALIEQLRKDLEALKTQHAAPVPETPAKPEG